ncbi:MAG: tetratricopeptide repeat protein [Pseudomonadota bacterium]
MPTPPWGSVHQALGQIEPAIASYRRAIALAPRYGSALCNLGNVLQATGRLDEAVDCYRRALAINANDATVQSNLGSALKALGRMDEAVACFERALQLRPELMEARLNLANAWLVQGELERAGSAYQEIARLRPDLPGVHSNLGMVLRSQGRMAAAIEAYRHGLAIKPDDPAAHANLGNVFMDLGRLDEAQASYERAIALKPDYLEVRSSLLMLLNYQPSLSAAALVDAHRAFERAVTPPAAALPSLPADAQDPERRLRIGYVSSDLGAHPVGYFMLPVLAAHDPAQVALHCYSGRLTEDAITARLRQPAEVWRSTVGVDDAALVAQIRADRIDLLIDLNGHTAGNRLAAFAHRPAPVQLTWLGYPATTGLSAIDYSADRRDRRSAAVRRCPEYRDAGAPAARLSLLCPAGAPRRRSRRCPPTRRARSPSARSTIWRSSTTRWSPPGRASSPRCREAACS